jgi:hypothetical protein
MAIARPLAYCPTCEVAFPIATRSEGGAFVVRNSTTNCPNGHFARILNAHYQSFEGEIQATLGAHSRTIRKAVLALWEKLCRRETTPEQARAEAERINSGLGSIFNAENFSDPTRKAILAALIPAAIAGAENDEEPITQPDHATAAAPNPEAKAYREVQEKRKGGNRAFQRSLRHKQRVLMNPRRGMQTSSESIARPFDRTEK